MTSPRTSAQGRPILRPLPELTAKTKREAIFGYFKMFLVQLIINLIIYFKVNNILSSSFHHSFAQRTFYLRGVRLDVLEVKHFVGMGLCQILDLRLRRLVNFDQVELVHELDQVLHDIKIGWTKQILSFLKSGTYSQGGGLKQGV